MIIKLGKDWKIGFDTLLYVKYIYLFLLKYDYLSYFDKNKIDWLSNYITSYKLLIFHINILDIHRQRHATINKLISSYKGNQSKVFHFFMNFQKFLIILIKPRLFQLVK